MDHTYLECGIGENMESNFSSTPRSMIVEQLYMKMVT
jgi:hypothetical protein